MLINQIKDNYTQIPNELITSNLSDKAKLIYCYLASKPTGWEFYNADIMKSLQIKRKDTIAAKLKELVESGWVERQKVTKEIARDKKLKAGTYIYTIYGYSKYGKSQSTEKPNFGKNRTQSNTELLSNTELNNKESQPYRLAPAEEEKKQEERVLADFNMFWSEYPKKKAKDEALKAFKKRYKELPLINELVEIVKLHKETEDWKKEKGQFIPYPATWLNQGRWEDEIKLPEEESIEDYYTWMKEDAD